MSTLPRLWVVAFPLDTDPGMALTDQDRPFGLQRLKVFFTLAAVFRLAAPIDVLRPEAAVRSSARHP